MRLFPRAAAVVTALVVCAAPLGVALVSAPASASVSIALTWDGLLQDSIAAAVVTSVESRPVWENGRIYTYTRVHVDRPMAGALGTGADVWVRTLGGVVGKVGQIVEGEAAFAPGETSLLFLRPGPVGAFVVTGRAQGQFPVVIQTAAGAPHIVKNNNAGMLLAPPALTTAAASPRLAADMLHGRVLDDVARDIAAQWTAAHAR